MIATERSHYVKGLDPVANAFAGTINSDVVNMTLYNHVEFIVYWGVGATGTTTLTVEACDDVVPTNTTAIPFAYRRISTGDTHGALIQATAAGFLTTAGSSQMYVIEVDAAALAALDRKYVRLHGVEGTASPILGGIMIRLSEARYAQAITDSAIV